MDNTTINIHMGDYGDDLLKSIITKVRSRRTAKPVQYETLLEIQLELRKHRKTMLGSNIPFSQFLCFDENAEQAAETNLIKYLSEQTLRLWGKRQGEYACFCQQFYEICFACPSYVTLDDIILFATTLVHDDRNVFIYAMEELLPPSYHEFANTFALDFPTDYYTPAFEDAVFGAICILLGALKDSNEEETQTHGN